MNYAQKLKHQSAGGGHGQILLEKEKESKGALLLYKYLLPHFATYGIKFHHRQTMNLCYSLL